MTLTLNAFTSGFHGNAATTGVGTPTHVRWVYGEQDFPGITIFEDGWMYHEDTPGIRSGVRLGWLVEPRSLRPENYARAWDVRASFDYILTYDAELLAADPGKFLLCPRMGVHVPRDKWGLREKSRNVAMLTTLKDATPGHRLRHEVARTLPGAVDVYGAGGYVDKVRALAPYRFVVVIECERAANWFTDHLLDVIALGCVPLYWGAPNIWEWLEERGMLTWETVDELRKILSGMLADHSRDWYALMLPPLARNLARLPRYALAEDWAYEHIFQHLEGVRA